MLTIERYFTKEGVHPYDEITWTKRDIRLEKSDGSGSVVFEQKDVECPSTWSANAVQIAASKYFYGTLGTPERETSIKQLITRVCHYFASNGEQLGYYDNQSAKIFEEELIWLAIHQYIAWNSPIYFNAGVYKDQYLSACYINEVEDNMESIMKLAHDQAFIFKSGAGSGTFFGHIRSSKEHVKGGGFACFSGAQKIKTNRGLIKISDVVENQDYAITPHGYKKISKLHNNGLQSIYKIIFQDNREIIATLDHQLFCINSDGEIIKRQIKDLIADKDHQIMFYNTYDDYTYGDTIEINHISSRKYKKLNINIEIDVDMAYILGMITGDGCIRRSKRRQSINITCDAKKPIIIEKICRILAIHGLKYHVRPRLNRGSIEIHIFNSNLVDALDSYNLLKNKSYNASIPALIFKSKPEIAKSYLAGYFDADGYIKQRDKNTIITFKTISKQLSQDTQELLASFGIYSTIQEYQPKQKNNKLTYCVAIINYKSKQIFVDHIGKYSEKVQFLSHVSINNHSWQSWQFDAVQKYISKSKIRTYMSKDVGIRLPNSVGTLSAVKIRDTLLSLNEIEDALKFDNIIKFSPIKIKAVEYIKDDTVYDITVDDEHAYLVNGIYVSNSGPCSFLKGYDAFSGVIRSGGRNRRSARLNSLNIDHPDIKEFIHLKEGEEKKAKILVANGYDHETASNSVFHQNGNNSICLTDEFMKAVEDNKEFSTKFVTTKTICETFKAKDLLMEIAQATWDHGDPGVIFLDECNRWHTTPHLGNIETTNVCGEILLSPSSACVLGNINILKYINDFDSDNITFNTVDYRKTIEYLLLSLDISIEISPYPTEKIKENTLNTRALGIGITNLGATLMVLGYPYDSDFARNFAKGIYAMLTSTGYRYSSIIAKELGKYQAYRSEYHILVIKNHIDNLNQYIHTNNLISKLLSDSANVWKDTLSFGLSYGYRNSQISAQMPCGTSGLIVDADTLAHEPAFALSTFKKLSGGGTMNLPLTCLPRALKNLRYTNAEIENIAHLIRQGKEITQIPYLNSNHYEIFQTAIGENSISINGHINMMAAVQSQISQSQSKTINCPNNTSVQNIYNLYLEAWRSKLKAVSVYRDGSKNFQPLNLSKKTTQEQKEENCAKEERKNTIQEESKPILDLAKLPTPQPLSKNGMMILPPEVFDYYHVIKDGKLLSLTNYTTHFEHELSELKKLQTRPHRMKLPDERQSITHRFEIAGHEGYLTVGLYDNGAPGELFITMSKEGSTISGLLDGFAIIVSLALQHGCALEKICEKMIYTRFEPSGFTKHPDIHSAKSIFDYIFRWLKIKFIDHQQEEEEDGDIEDNTTNESDEFRKNGSITGTIEITGTSALIQEENQKKITLTNPSTEGILCSICGSTMFRQGTCFYCHECGNSTGCS